MKAVPLVEYLTDLHSSHHQKRTEVDFVRCRRRIEVALAVHRMRIVVVWVGTVVHRMHFVVVGRVGQRRMWVDFVVFRMRFVVVVVAAAVAEVGKVGRIRVLAHRMRWLTLRHHRTQIQCWKWYYFVLSQHRNCLVGLRKLKIHHRHHCHFHQHFDLQRLLLLRKEKSQRSRMH